MLSAVAGGGTGFGLYLVARGARRGPARVTLDRAHADKLAWLRRPGTVTGLAVGIAALVITRWPMAFPLGVAAVLGLKGLGAGTGPRAIEKLDAIASWTEMVRDTLAGASGLSQALVVTAATAPVQLRSEITLLAGKLRAGVAVELALRELADDISDPSADMVVAALLMASRERAQRLGDLLSALSVSIRDEVAMRLGIEASRASSRTAVRMIAGFSLGLFGLMSVFARAYLSPYRAATGQLALGLVGLLFAAGLYLMSAMVRPQPLPRLGLSGSIGAG
ncbi:MAG: type II secretion system F family protein [Acidimicrobiales bacterium]